MSFEEAKRKATPMLIALSAPSGGGKTFSALLMAAGMAGKDGKVGFIDTEQGRGSMYADDPLIVEAMPDGKYYIEEMSEPFTPKKYTEAIKRAIAAGITQLVIDSVTHEWEGLGGCIDIAENNKLGGMPNWAKAKLEHKKFTNLLTQCPIDLIFCLRAREKTKPMKDDKGKTVMVDMGLQPIQEKNFMFEMTLSMMMHDHAAGKPILTKCPKPLLHLFKSDDLITKQTGELLKSWSDGGESINNHLRSVMRDCREAAMSGSVALDDYYRNLSKEDKFALAKANGEFKAETRSLADEADRVAAESSHEDEEQEKLKFNE